MLCVLAARSHTECREPATIFQHRQIDDCAISPRFVRCCSGCKRARGMEYGILHKAEDIAEA